MSDKQTKGDDSHCWGCGAPVVRWDEPDGEGGIREVCEYLAPSEPASEDVIRRAAEDIVDWASDYAATTATVFPAGLAARLNNLRAALRSPGGPEKASEGEPRRITGEDVRAAERSVIAGGATRLDHYARIASILNELVAADHTPAGSEGERTT